MVTKAAKAAASVDGAQVIESAIRLTLGPDDVLVFRAKELIRPEFRVYLQKQMRALFPDNRVVVIDGPIDLFVVSEAEAAGDPD